MERAGCDSQGNGGKQCPRTRRGGLTHRSCHCYQRPMPEVPRVRIAAQHLEGGGGPGGASRTRRRRWTQPSAPPRSKSPAGELPSPGRACLCRTGQRWSPFPRVPSTLEPDPYAPHGLSATVGRKPGRPDRTPTHDYEPRRRPRGASRASDTPTLPRTIARGHTRTTRRSVGPSLGPSNGRH